ncbi:DUF5709 domain-containing protein [Nocardioides sp. CPCC 205120]|uniref:DUF5709 domain-containing protein n=1 Tax=Nocardioides sp. CPCC 205120 TaxID=3406462 RepID=UPI003B512140
MSQDGVASEIGTDPGVDVSGDTTDNENYHGYSVDDENQPQSTGDSLVDDDRGLVDPMDEGYSPPEKWSAGQRYGNTPLEESMGETLDQRLDQEEPEPDPYEEAERADAAGDLATLVTEAPAAEDQAAQGSETREVGDPRSGRLVAPDEGVRTDTEKDLVATDVGIDGAAAGAEEAAVHVVDEDDLPA